MKLLKRVLGLILVIGIFIGVIREIGKIGGTRLRPPIRRDLGEVKEKPIRFAVMGDIHSDWESFRKALERTKENKGNEGDREFVVVVGDLTAIGKKSELLEAKKILDESGLKYFVIPGNHDIWWGRKYKKDVWREVFGESFGSFRVDGKKFILVNNGDGENGTIGVIGKIGPASPAKRGEGIREKQGDWIKKEVAECLKIYCLVFMHMPLNHPTSLHVMGEESPAVASEAAGLRQLLVENRVKEVFAGHLHFSSSYELGGLKTTIVGAITSERNFQSPKFLEVTLENGKIERSEVFVPN